MRTLIALTIVCLVFYGVTTEAAQGKSHVSDLRQHLERAKSCSLQCKPGPGSVDTSKNWVIRLNVNIYLVYNAQYSYLAIYNSNLGIAVVYDSISSILLIVNVNTGDSLLIRAQIGLFVKGSGAIIQFNTDTGVFDGIDLCYQIIVRYKVQITANTSTTTGGCFSVTILLNYLLNLNGEIDLTTVVNRRTDLAIQLKAAFGFYFQLITTGLKSGAINVLEGDAILIKGALELSSTKSDLYLSIYDFFKVLGINNKIAITADIMNKFYSGVIKNDVEMLNSLHVLLFNVGSLYTSTAAAFLAYNNGYFTYSEKSLFINGHESLLVFSRDSNTQSWIIHIIGKSNLFILYSNNCLVILNLSNGLVFVFPRSTIPYSVYNGRTGVAIVISKLSGDAKIIETNSGAIAKAYLAQNFLLAISLMTTATGKITSVDFIFSRSTFHFAKWLASVHRYGAAYTSTLDAATKSKIDANFNALIVNFVGITGYNQLYGDFNVLLIAFKGLELGYLPGQFVLLVSVICGKQPTLFNGSILKQVYYAVEASASVSFSVSAIFTFIPGGGGSVSSSSS